MTHAQCPTCHVGMATEQLVRQTWVVDLCPYCKMVVRQYENREEQLVAEVERLRTNNARLQQSLALRESPHVVVDAQYAAGQDEELRRLRLECSTLRNALTVVAAELAVADAKEADAPCSALVHRETALAIAETYGVPLSGDGKYTKEQVAIRLQGYQVFLDKSRVGGTK